MLCAAPIKHNCVTRTAQIINRDSDERFLPLYVFEIDLEWPKIGRRELAGKNRLRSINDGLVNPAVQLLCLRIT